MLKKSALLLMALVAIGGCAAQTVSTAVPGAATTPAAGAATAGSSAADVAYTAAPVVADTPAPTGPAVYKAGDTVTVQQNGSDWAKIGISGVKVVGSYKGSYYTDTPKTKGDVFIQAKVTYQALTDGVTYNPFDWSVFCAGTAVDSFTILINGPTPELNSGTLPNGKNASGYVVYEVAAKGEVDMYYGGAFGGTPVFEVIIRAS